MSSRAVCTRPRELNQPAEPPRFLPDDRSGGASNQELFPKVHIHPLHESSRSLSVMVSKTDLNCNLAGALMPPQSTVSLRGPPGKFRQRPEFRQPCPSRRVPCSARRGPLPRVIISRCVAASANGGKATGPAPDASRAAPPPLT